VVSRAQVLDERVELQLAAGSLGMVGLTESLYAICDEADDVAAGAVTIRIGAATNDVSWPGDVATRDVSRWEQAVRRLERLRTPTIALAAGPCGGPTLALLLATTYRIGSTDLSVTVPAVSGRAWPGMELFRLARELGSGRARRVVLGGRAISAESALDFGLIDEIADDPLAALDAAAARLASIGGDEVAVRRQLLAEAGECGFEDALGAHLAACDRELRKQRRPNSA
jgi:isomerase DpgB